MTRRRPAITLIETLVAIFIMAIGLLALLTLFPLGAISMAQALKDQRTAEAAINATAQYNAFGIGTDSYLYGAAPTINYSSPNTYFENPWPPPGPPPGSLPALGPTAAPSYPIYIDPLGISGGKAVGGLLPNNTYGAVGIRRVSPNKTVPANQAKLFTLQDDLTFGTDGTADTTSVGYVQREGRYTWAYMVRRAAAGVALSEVPLDMTVVVYSGRSPGVAFNAPNAFVYPSGEYPYVNTTFAQDNRSAVIAWSAGVDPKPAVRRGTWILDCRMLDTANNPAPQGYFYRVVSATDLAPTVINGQPMQQIEVVLQAPLGGPPRPVATLPRTGPLVVMENVSEVFEKGTNY